MWSWADRCFTAPLTGRLAGFNVLIADIGLLKYSDNVKIQTKLIVKKFVVLPSKATYLNLVFQTIGYDEGQAPGVSESSKIDMFPSLVADVPQRSKPTGSSTINLESFHIQQALRISPTIIDVWIITEELALTTSSINPRVAFSVSPCSWLLENDSKAHGPPSFSPARPRLAVALINRSNHPPDATIPIYVKGQKNKQAASRQPNSPFCRASEISMAAPKPASHLQQSCSLELLQRRIWKLAGAWRVSSSAVARGSHRSQGSNHCASTLPRRLWNGRRTTTTPIGVTQ
ncbi:hypothetical protein BKA81DRAFT_394909 [Phyllosticta paracitricarpa]